MILLLFFLATVVGGMALVDFVVLYMLVVGASSLVSGYLACYRSLMNSYIPRALYIGKRMNHDSLSLVPNSSSLVPSLSCPAYPA